MPEYSLPSILQGIGGRIQRVSEVGQERKKEEAKNSFSSEGV